MAQDDREKLGKPGKADFAGPRGRVIPWPASRSNKVSDPLITNVQIAIEDQAYAEQLRALLEEDTQHRAYVVDRPSPEMDGVVVLDETTLGHVGVLEPTEAQRYIVLRKGPFDHDKLWQTGIRCVIPADYPPNLVRTVILGTELRLNIEQAERAASRQDPCC
jgi:hypothetical protein